MKCTRSFHTLIAGFLLNTVLLAQGGFEITIPVPGLTNVAAGQPLPDGGFVFGGEVGDGVVVVRTDSTGQVLWTRVLAEAEAEEGIYDRSLAVSGDRIFMGGYALGNNTASRDGVLHILGFDGEVIGQRLIHAGNGSNAVHSLTATANGVLVAGRAEGAGSYDMLIQELDSSGAVLNSWSYGSTGWDWAYEAIALTDGGRALVGYGDDVGGPAPSAYLVKTDGVGQELWARGLDGASADEGYSVAEDPENGDLYIGGRTLGMGAPGTRGFISKFNSAGDHQWTRVINNAFDVIGIKKVSGRFVALARAQNITGGFGNYAELLLFFGADGTLLYNRLFGTDQSDFPVSLAYVPGDRLLITTFKGGVGNSIRAVLVDINGNGGCNDASVDVGWASYEPTVFNHTSTIQTGSNVSDWPTESAQLSLTGQYECCPWPVEAAFTAQQTEGDPFTWQFISSSTGDGTLTWTVDGTQYSGDTVEHVFSNTGTFEVCLEITGVCAIDDSCATVLITADGMLDRTDGTDLQVWPQPSADLLNISGPFEMRKVELVDGSGRVVLVRAMAGARTAVLDVHSLAPGSYVVRMIRAQGIVQRSIMKY